MSPADCRRCNSEIEGEDQGLFSPLVMSRDLIDIYQEDPRSQNRDLGHPSVEYLLIGG
jgi:hypothetical protein